MDILLVDDNPLMQQLIARFLGDLGYQISVAGRADDAIELARGGAPRLFMIDMHLPDLDGPEALHALRARVEWLGDTRFRGNRHRPPPDSVTQSKRAA